jgi:hypothetical protein
MRRSLIASSVAILLGCSNGVLAPPANLTGTWSAHWVESSTTLSLVQLGDSIAGSGQYFRFINPPTGTIAVAGSYARPLVSLTFRYDTGITTHFVGVVGDATHMAGIETFPGGTTDSLAFERR